DPSENGAHEGFSQLSSRRSHPRAPSCALRRHGLLARADATRQSPPLRRHRRERVPRPRRRRAAVVNESRRRFGGHTAARTSRSTHREIFAIVMRSGFAAAGLGRLSDFGVSRRTSTLTPIAWPYWTAARSVIRASLGTRHPATASRIG